MTLQFESVVIRILLSDDHQQDIIFSEAEVTTLPEGWVLVRGKRLAPNGDGTRWTMFTELFPKEDVVRITGQGEKR